MFGISFPIVLPAGLMICNIVNIIDSLTTSSFKVLHLNTRNTVKYILIFYSKEREYSAILDFDKIF